MGKEFLKIKESSEAKKIIGDLFDKYYTSESEVVSLGDSYNRVLFTDIESKIDFPPFNRALKDGYAVKVEDTYGASEESPKTVKVIDIVEAGDFCDKPLNLGECVQISTGAPMPEDAEAVEMVEFSDIDEEGNVNLFKSLTPNQEVGLKGSDIKKGNKILDKNETLTPAKIGVIASQGIGEVEVYKKPKVGIVSTGNELLSNSETISPGKIYDVNSDMLKTGADAAGADAVTLGIIKDDYDSIKDSIVSSLKKSDVVLVSGGTSAGIGDNLRSILDELGCVIIHGISVQPGKPTLVGVIDNKLVIGLPGNPVSAIVIFNVFVAPSLRKLAGIKIDEEINTFSGPITKRIHSPVGRMQYQLVRIKDGGVEPIFKDSGAIFSLATADGYTKVDKNTELVNEGEIVNVTLFK
ncbi:MAG: molybdopterin molybdenumtransferase MoeA [Methanobacteriaceae archaeon]|nr:molybdopterin molybdenumtransferase MoeA [Methanobacteriaceae archaeon]